MIDSVMAGKWTGRRDASLRGIMLSASITIANKPLIDIKIETYAIVAKKNWESHPRSSKIER
jgi:hypothetical protein